MQLQTRHSSESRPQRRSIFPHPLKDSASPVSEIKPSILDLIGKTPLVRLNRLTRDVPVEIWAKLEFFNPSGSVKDRIALAMIAEAEKKGLIRPGATIIEPTSGNTGISLALVCAVKGYKMIAVMPGAMSSERAAMMKLLGARVEIVPTRDNVPGLFTKEDIDNTIRRAQEIQAETPGAYVPNQFENPDNPHIHALTTAREIIDQTVGKFQAFVAACGTGGTFCGVAAVLKEQFPQIRRVVVEPKESAVIAGGQPGPHKIQGIGEGFIPKVMDVTLVDEAIGVSDADAILTAKRLAAEEGVLTGLSGGANVFAALEVGKKMKKGEVVVTIIPDNSLRYLSTELCRCQE